MAKFSRLAIPLRNGDEVVFEEDGTIRIPFDPEKQRIEGIGTTQLRFYSRESSPGPAPTEAPAPVPTIGTDNGEG